MELAIDQAMQQGIIAHNQGKLNIAESFYRSSFQIQSFHSDANNNLGVLAISFNKSELASPLLKTALKECLDKLDRYLKTGFYIKAFFKEKKYDLVLGVFETAKSKGLPAEIFDPLKMQLNSSSRNQKSLIRKMRQKRFVSPI